MVTHLYVFAGVSRLSVKVPHAPALVQESQSKEVGAQIELEDGLLACEEELLFDEDLSVSEEEFKSDEAPSGSKEETDILDESSSLELLLDESLQAAKPREKMAAVVIAKIILFMLSPLYTLKVSI